MNNPVINAKIANKKKETSVKLIFKSIKIKNTIYLMTALSKIRRFAHFITVNSL